jgi:hypothetical protein
MYSGLYMAYIWLCMSLLCVRLYPLLFPGPWLHVLEILVLDAFPRSVILAYFIVYCFIPSISPSIAFLCVTLYYSTPGLFRCVLTRFRAIVK